MKIYVDFNDLDVEDLPSSICNKYKLEVRSTNGGSEYKCDVLSLADHDAELLKNAIVPKFKIGQEVWFIRKKQMRVDKGIVYGFVNDKCFRIKSGGSHHTKETLFLTKKEAELKLKELQGETL